MAFSSQRPFHPGQSCVRLSVPPHFSLKRKEGERNSPSSEAAQKSLGCNPFSAYASGPWTLTPLLHQHDRVTRARAKVRTGRAVSSFMTWNFFKKRTINQRTLFEPAHERFWDGLTLPVQNQLIPDQLWFLPSMTHPSISFTPLCWRGNT